MRIHTAQMLRFVALVAFLPQRTSAQTLLWSDEFETPGAPDPRVWGYDTGSWGWGNIEYQDYTDSRDNSFVDDEGRLNIVARRNPDGLFTSARLKTDEKLFVQYGTVTARIQIPNVVNGLWPGFWTLGKNFQQVDWPASGEIDIMEVGDGFSLMRGEGNRRVISAVHMQRADGTYYYNYTWSEARPVDLHLDFHLYRLEWTPESISMYVDDYRTHTFNINLDTCNGCEELHQPHYFIFNLAVGGKYNLRPGIDDPYNQSRITATLPATVLIDYIRVTDNGFSRVSGPGVNNGDDGGASVPPPPTPPPVAPPTPAPQNRPLPPTKAPIEVTRPPLITIEPTSEILTLQPTTLEPTTVAPTTNSPVVTTSSPVVTTSSPVVNTSSPVAATAPPTTLPSAQPTSVVIPPLETEPPMLNETELPMLNETPSPAPSVTLVPSTNATVPSPVVGAPVSTARPTPQPESPTPSPTLDPNASESLAEASYASSHGRMFAVWMVYLAVAVV